MDLILALLIAREVAYTIAGVYLWEQGGVCECGGSAAVLLCCCCVAADVYLRVGRARPQQSDQSRYGSILKERLLILLGC